MHALITGYLSKISKYKSQKTNKETIIKIQIKTKFTFADDQAAFSKYKSQKIINQSLLKQRKQSKQEAKVLVTSIFQ
jgi:hypothetical protein